MIRGHEFGAMVYVKMPPEGGDPLFGPQEGLCGKGPEGADDFWFDNLQLLDQKGEARLDLIGSGITIIGGAAFHDIGDIYILSRQVYSLDDAGEELPGPADKRFALLILVSARALSHKDEGGMGVAIAEDQAVSHFMEPAPSALSQLLSDALECQGFFPCTL